MRNGSAIARLLAVSIDDMLHHPGAGVKGEHVAGRIIIERPEILNRIELAQRLWRNLQHRSQPSQ
jgi:hypothetical protein